MKKVLLGSLLTGSLMLSAQALTDYVNPFIGTSNYGTTNPGAIVPQGLMSVTPFNVTGSTLNKFDKDKQWWSTPYSSDNSFFTGFAHVNLSGVGCPEVGTLLTMPTAGGLNVNYTDYGSTYSEEVANPGYYSNTLSKYGIRTEVTATERSSRERFTFPQGESHILLNLGEGLTNETGAWMKWTGDQELVGMRLAGTFCYNSQAVFPLYFVMRVNKKPVKSGYWKMQPEMTAEAEWEADSGKRKLYTRYRKEIAGDDIGAFLSFETAENEQIEVQMGVSMVSIENARLNLETEQKDLNFNQIRQQAQQKWENRLQSLQVKGGTEDEKTIFYTALYHTLIHPNLLNDVNGDYPAMESDKILRTDHRRYTVFSLWDTYRNVHQLMTLLYPGDQLDMVRSMVGMYKESGWLPRWELFGRETLTMDGDPAIPVIVDSYRKGLRDFDVGAVYEAMVKSATTPGKDNFIREDNDDYWKLGYVPLRGKYDNSTSHGLEYYIADNALSKFAQALGKKKDAERFYKQSLNYKKYFSPEYQLIRPRLADGSFVTPFDPKQGENFEPVPGFHEGSSWNYSFMIPHDVPGMIKMYGGPAKFVKRLNELFTDGHYDPTNEPNIGAPYLFSYVKGEAWRTQELTKELVKKYFKNTPDGLPGNDDTGTMSTWALFSMMGFYPDDPTDPSYTFTYPFFDEVTLNLDPKFYNNRTLHLKTIRKNGDSSQIEKITVDGKVWSGFRISHEELTNAREVVFYLK